MTQLYRVCSGTRESEKRALYEYYNKDLENHFLFPKFVQKPYAEFKVRFPGETRVLRNA